MRIQLTRQKGMCLAWRWRLRGRGALIPCTPAAFNLPAKEVWVQVGEEGTGEAGDVKSAAARAETSGTAAAAAAAPSQSAAPPEAE